MKYAINYADRAFHSAQKYNTQTAYKKGRFDKVFEYSPENINKEFLEKNQSCFVEGDHRIGKFGLWRPLIIVDALNKIEIGDYLFYCDSGAYYVNSIDYLIEEMEQNRDEIMIFDIPFIEKQWTKRDIFVYLKCDNKKYTDSNQRMSTAFLLKKGKKSMEFFNEYMKIATEAPFLFTDENNILGKNNYENFIDNRHNQSVLSVLSKKYNLNSYMDPSEYGKRPNIYLGLYGDVFKDMFPNCQFNIIKHENKYPQIILSHRKGKVTFKVRMMGWIRSNFPAKAFVLIYKWNYLLKNKLK